MNLLQRGSNLSATMILYPYRRQLPFPGFYYIQWSWTSMAQTSLGPWKSVLDLGSWRATEGYYICLCWGFTAQSTQWGHVERGQFT